MKMNERLSTRSLAEQLANQTGLDRKSAEEFIDTLTSYFTQGLERNKVVKIFGLGVFKIMLVRERESVHIQTGERFVIPAHHKLTFIPDKNFKEQINRPFALFEPIEAPESELLDFNYEDELPESILMGDSASYADELSETASYEDKLPEPTALANSGYYEKYLPEEESITNEDELPETPLAENAYYEEELPEPTALANSGYYENYLSEEENASNENELSETPLASYEDELSKEEGLTYEEDLPITPLYIEDYFSSDLINEVIKNSDEETFFEDFANEIESIPESQNDNVLYEEQTVPGFLNVSPANEEETVTEPSDEELEYEVQAASASSYEEMEYDKQVASESSDEELPYNVVSVSTTYTHKPDETEAPVAEKSESTFFAPGKKRKNMLVWFYLVVIPVCIIIGSIIGAYIFLGINAERTSLVKQNQDVSNFTSLTDISSVSPFDVDSNSNDMLPDTLTQELNPEPESNESPANSNIPVSQNDDNEILSTNNSSENNTSDTNSIRKQEIEPVTDWLVPSPDNIRTNGTRRVNAPNRALEDRNRALSNNSRQSTTGSTTRTTTGNTSTTTATTSTTANARALPTSIRMRAGSTLTQIALDYYGNKVFWVYIYEHNRNLINDPHKVPIGTELQLPSPSAYGIDSKNAASLQRAAQKQAQYN